MKDFDQRIPVAPKGREKKYMLALDKLPSCTAFRLQEKSACLSVGKKILVLTKLPPTPLLKSQMFCPLGLYFPVGGKVLV